MTRLGVSSYHSDDDAYQTLKGLVKGISASGKAILFWWEDDEDTHWIPKSVCAASTHIDINDVEIEVAEWWLKKEGLL